MIAPSPARALRATAALFMVGTCAYVVSAPGLAAQAVAAPVSVALSADTVGIGDVFELTVSVELPADRFAYFPDSLAPGAGFATARPVEWSADRAEDGSATLSLTYPLLSVQVGIVSVPPFDLYTMPGRTEADPLRGAWSALLDRDDLLASAVASRVPESRLWVASVLMLDDITNGLQPRPADDVWGGGRHWPSTLAMFLFGTLLLGVVGAAARDWVARTGAAQADATPPPTPKALALAALDELLQAGLHSNGRIDEFYLRSSDIARRYIETLDDSWDAALTSGELMAALVGRPIGEHGDGLRTEMGSAETVKFGRFRPDIESAEVHWHSLYEWIEQSRERDE